MLLILSKKNLDNGFENFTFVKNSVMQNREDYLLIEDALVMSSKQLGKQVWSASVMTPNFIFVVPKKAVGMYGIVYTVQNHDFFQGVAIEEGLKRFISEISSVDELESKMKQLLENDERYVFPISNAKTIKVKGFFGKKTLMYRVSARTYVGINPKSKKEGLAMSEWYVGNYSKELTT